MVYWLICCFFAICAVRVQVQNHKHASSAVRKIFHALIVAVYLPGLAWECTLLYLSSGVALALLILVEVKFQLSFLCEINYFCVRWCAF